MSHTDDRHVPEHAPDHESDPARTPGDGWVGEGGASHLGPATHTDSGRPAADEADDGETPAAE
ncbi:hypothetical protein MUN76_11130 [Leucobacter rhizosphaerae]|uniref:Uncharacterized protein n=1 Tax=Leucobacter rhizosphaerae TaxID=2932245 RepID=A0ABY4FTH4_9MICO|nr:hypothetical protein [Leucobacter rhizosphaerae]UOQ59599.1 hypothetical protein MUN76_11130 [Leucobacter rhizosphaerae]